MRCASHLSTHADLDHAIEESVRAVQEGLGDRRADLTVLFAGMRHRAELDRAGPLIHEALGGPVLLGCSAEGVIGTGQEVEGGGGLSLWAASMPGARLEPLRLETEAKPAGAAEAELHGWTDAPRIGPSPSSPTCFVILADPFTFLPQQLLRRVEQVSPRSPVIGGMASGGFTPGQHRLFLGDRVYTTGAVGVAIRGGVRLETVVSQGCRPIGRPFIVTRAKDHLIFELAGQPSLRRFQEVYAALDDGDQQRVRSGLHLGRVVDEYRTDFRRGDFLVRNVVGVDQQSGALAIGGDLSFRRGQTVQFHVRDPESAGEDLSELLDRVLVPHPGEKPRGGLLFSCNGRGRRFFVTPDHDATSLARHVGEIPLGGFFAMGELGPVGGQNFLHGFTASIGLFFDPPPQASGGAGRSSTPR